MGWGREDRKEQGPLESYAESPMPHEAKRSKSVCPDVHMVKNVIVYFNKPRATEHPTYLLVFTNFLIFVFVVHVEGNPEGKKQRSYKVCRYIHDLRFVFFRVQYR